MNFFWRFSTALLVLAGLMAAPLRTDAQFILNASASPNPVIVSNIVTFTINVTNTTAGSMPNVVVTNLFSPPIQISNTNGSQGGATTISNGVVFFVGPLGSGGGATLTFDADPTNTGSFTDHITAFDSTTLSFASTTVTLQSVTSTNVVTVPVNLGVAINGPVQAVITNDIITYNVIVTNATGTSVSGVTVTNVLPPGIIFKSVSPSGLKLSTTKSNQVFSLGTLATSALTNINVTIEPTNAGIITLSAFIHSSSGTNSNVTNSFATTNITVMDYLPGTFTITTNSGPTINRQNLLVEQSVLVSNTGTTDAPAVRLVVSDLTNHLFNAVGTNDVNPFVYFSAPLPAGQSVSLLLQFNPRSTTFALTNGQVHAFAVPTPNWTPPNGIATQLAGTNGVSTTITNLGNGTPLIQFPATLGRSYTIVYADNMAFSNAMIAPPAVVAPANVAQFIDYGPPTTVSPPGISGPRFYKVFLNQ